MINKKIIQNKNKKKNKIKNCIKVKYNYRDKNNY